MMKFALLLFTLIELAVVLLYATNPDGKSEGQKMVRYQIEDGEHITIAYGNDQLTGLFLSVYDRRLKWSSDTSGDVNAVTEKVGCGDGGGAYFDLHTGNHGFGHRVSQSTIVTFMQRYGVPKERIEELLSRRNSLGKGLEKLNLNKGEHDKDEIVTPSTSSSVAATNCAYCGQTASQRCAKCHKSGGQEVFYCSKKCQLADWPSHKHFCSLTIPKKTKNEGGKRSVLAVLLSENDPKPSFMEIPIERVEDEEVGWYWSADATAIFGNSIKGHSYKNLNVKANRPLKQMLHFMYRDNFAKDKKSQTNKCVQKMLNGEMPPNHWKGPILVLKDKGTNFMDQYGSRRDYMDMQLSDAGDIVDFFQSYGRDHQWIG